MADSSNKEYFVGTIHQKDISAVNTGFYKTIVVEGVKVNFQLDTGVKCNRFTQSVQNTQRQDDD